MVGCGGLHASYAVFSLVVLPIGRGLGVVGLRWDGSVEDMQQVIKWNLCIVGAVWVQLGSVVELPPIAFVLIADSLYWNELITKLLHCIMLEFDLMRNSYTCDDEYALESSN